jgi:O-antigen/teichoic acid export membrane protein
VSGVAFARLLGPADRGYLALLILWPGILFQLVGIGLAWSVAYHIAGRSLDVHRAALVLARPFAIQSAVLLLAHVVILLIYLPGRPRDVAMAGAMTIPLGPAYLVWDYSLALLQGLKQYLYLNLLRLLPIFLVACVALAMLAARDRSLVHVVIYFTICNVACALVTAGVARQKVLSEPHPEPVASEEPDLVGFGLRGYFGSLYPLDSFRLDQVIVGVMLPPSALGLYVVASSFANLPRFIAQNVALVALPHIASRPDTQSRRAPVVRFVAFGAILLLLIVVVLEASVALLVPLLFGDTFKGSVQLAQILLIGALCLGIRRVLAESLKGAGFPLAGTLAETASWLLLLPVLVLALQGGVIGVAWSVSLSFAFSLSVLVALALGADWRLRHARGSAVR